MSTKQEEWIAYLQGVNKLYEHRFGHPPDGSDRAKATHFTQWRFGGQALIDAVARIRELETR